VKIDIRALAVAGAIGALALPGTALAHRPDDRGHGKPEAGARADAEAQAKSQEKAGKRKGPQRCVDGRKTDRRSLVLKGTVVSVDAAGKSAVVHVKKGNKSARPFAGKDVTVDLSSAKITVFDADRNGVRDLNDVKAGDRVVVQVRLARCIKPDEPLKARRFIDQTRPKQTQPAPEQPPAEQPPAEQPPAQQPPAEQPPAEQQPAQG
jgi:hypothetical protein